jgi:hypothetical protein
MSVNFGHALWQIRNQPCEPRMRNSAAPGQSENLIGRSDASPLQTRALKARPTIHGRQRRARAGSVDPPQDRPRLHRHANVLHAKFRRQGENSGENRWMQVKMLVSVDMVEGQSCGAEGLELGADLRQHLSSRTRQKKHRGACSRHVRSEPPARINQIGHRVSRQDGPSLHQRQMEAYRQPREPPRQLHGGGRRRPTDHQARRGEQPFLMRDFNGAINLFGEAEIVRRDNKIFQCAISRRSRRKRKNSTPSRRRRFIIWGLSAISPTIAAILLGRK